MSHQRYPSHGDAVKEPHSVSLKVLRLSRPSLVAQSPVQPPPPPSTAAAAATTHRHPPPIPASLAYSPSSVGGNESGDGVESTTNPDAFILSPIVNLPPSFGSAYVGETFSCTLCVNHDVVEGGGTEMTIRDVRIEAEMKTPGMGGGGVTKLELSPGRLEGNVVVPDLLPGGTLQKILGFDLKDEGNHVLAVTVSYYEATDVSGRTRTFRKLYQFICKGAIIVRTKVGEMGGGLKGGGRRRWVLEAQLENCGEDGVWIERVGLEVERGLAWRDCNWGVGSGGDGDGGVKRPVLHPGEVEQVCFVVEEVGEGDGDGGGRVDEMDGRMVFGVLGIGWRSEMGNRGFLSTGKLGTRVVKGRD